MKLHIAIVGYMAIKIYRFQVLIHRMFYTVVSLLRDINALRDMGCTSF